jgi:hypothetical protein
MTQLETFSRLPMERLDRGLARDFSYVVKDSWPNESPDIFRLRRNKVTVRT